MTTNGTPAPWVAYRAERKTLEELNDLGSFFWAPLLLDTLDGVPELELPPIRGVTLAGEPGNGRHTLADALSGTLRRRGCGGFVRITGAALDDMDAGGACAVIGDALGQLCSHERFCLLVDRPEDSRHSAVIQEHLLRQMEEQGDRLFLILITGALERITPALQEMTTVCQLLSPGLTERRNWLRASLEGRIPIPMEGNMNYITLTKESEGFTWRQMTDLRTLLRRLLAVKAGAALTREEVRGALACVCRQRPRAEQAVAVQYVAPMAAEAPAAKAPAEEPPVTGDEEDSNRKAKEFHSHPEKMTFSQLADIDEL